MFQKVDFVQTAQIFSDKETCVKFAENLEFTCSKDLDGLLWHGQIKNVKGDFEITKIIQNFHDGNSSACFYEKLENKFNLFSSSYVSCKFFITANIELKEMSEEMQIVSYQLYIPSSRLICLKLFHFIKSEFFLPGYDSLKFTYYIKKIKESYEKDIEIYVENPYDIEIQGKKGDFKIEQSSSKNVDIILSFNVTGQKLDTCESEMTKQKCEVGESRPESVIPSQLSNKNSKLIKIGSNRRFPDVFFITSDGTKIPAHRNILAEYSIIFAQIFNETSETPIKIDVDDFAAETIQSAVDFIYSKTGSDKEIKAEVFEFAIKYGIQDLIKTWRSFFEESVAPTNIQE
uniref:BTB domain-containing protein n=1 Tax=Panagrolaimus sp. ES5 TaxID=591445 RepID=A0AC34F3J7_9BILA